MKDTHQIAAEAWKQITESDASSNPETYIAMIKSAIEKAYNTGYVQREKDIQSLRDSFEKAGYPHPAKHTRAIIPYQMEEQNRKEGE